MSENKNKQCVRIQFFTKDNIPKGLKNEAEKQGFDVNKSKGIIAVKTFI